jgi:hypothetical protein
MITGDERQEIEQEIREELEEQYGEELNDRLKAARDEMIEEVVSWFEYDLTENWEGWEFMGGNTVTSDYFDDEEWEKKKRDIKDEVKQEYDEEFNERLEVALNEAENVA